MTDSELGTLDVWLRAGFLPSGDEGAKKRVLCIYILGHAPLEGLSEFLDVFKEFATSKSVSGNRSRISICSMLPICEDFFDILVERSLFEFSELYVS
jgi:hypothetical protein